MRNTSFGLRVLHNSRQLVLDTLDVQLLLALAHPLDICDARMHLALEQRVDFLERLAFGLNPEDSLFLV